MEANNLQEDQRIAFIHANKIAVVGMPLAGKSTLIHEMGGCDLDDIIEHLTQQKIPDLLAAGLFREEETKALRYLVEAESSLIALGGGAILKRENLDVLRDYFVVFLDTPLPLLHERLKTSHRPLIKKPVDLDRLFIERYPLYVAVARLCVDDVTLKGLLKEKMSL